MIAALLDTETTGIDNAEVIEMAYADVAPDLRTFGPAVVTRYSPVKQTTYGALAVHHILPEELVDCPPSAGAKMPEGLQYLIGHNIDFDWKVLGSPSVKRICTLACCREIWPECDAHSLTAMVYFLLGPVAATRSRLKDAHSASVDVENNLLVLDFIVQKTGSTTLESLWKFSEEARIPKKMGFGKHKGKLVSEVDAGYVKWYRGQADQDEYLLEAWRRCGLIRGRN